MSHQTHVWPWGEITLTLHCMDPKYFCCILVELVTTYIFASYIFVTQTILSFTVGSFWPHEELFQGLRFWDNI